MMEEISITVAYDAHVINQICEEDILASLVALSKPPKPVVGLSLLSPGYFGNSTLFMHSFTA